MDKFGTWILLGSGPKISDDAIFCRAENVSIWFRDLISAYMMFLFGGTITCYQPPLCTKTLRQTCLLFTIKRNRQVNIILPQRRVY